MPGFLQGTTLNLKKSIQYIHLLISPIIILSPCIIVPIPFSFCVGGLTNVVKVNGVQTTRKIFKLSSRWCIEPWWRSHWFWCRVSRARRTVQLWTGRRRTWARTPIWAWRTASFGTRWLLTIDACGDFRFFRFSLYFSPSHISWFFSLFIVVGCYLIKSMSILGYKPPWQFDGGAHEQHIPFEAWSNSMKGLWSNTPDRSELHTKIYMPSCILSELTGTGKLLKIVENLNVLTQEVTNFPRLQANCSRISPKFKYVCSFLIHLTNKFRVWLWKYLEKCKLQKQLKYVMQHNLCFISNINLLHQTFCSVWYRLYNPIYQIGADPRILFILH